MVTRLSMWQKHNCVVDCPLHSDSPTNIVASDVLIMGYRLFGYSISLFWPPNILYVTSNAVSKMAIRVYQAVSEIGFLLKPLG